MQSKDTIWKKFRQVILFIFALLMFTPITIQAENETPVRVGWYEDAYNITGKNGERSGYGYEYQQSVAAYTGWTYEYVKDGWSELFQMIQDGKIDLMGGVSYTEERAQHMLYSELPMGEEKYYLYADTKHTDISPADLSTLNGKRIALLDGSVQATQFYDWEKEHDIHLEPVYVNSFEEGKTMADNREIDCVISTETPQWIQYGMSSIAVTGGSEIYFVINKNRPDLKKELDDAMRNMENDRPFYSDELYKRYLSAVSSAVVTKDESEWLHKHGKIRIGWVNHDIGVSDDDIDGQPVGVINDYIGFAENCLENEKLEFEPVKFDTFDEQLEALDKGEIDMIFHVSQNPYMAEENSYILSNTVMTVTTAAVTGKDYFNENDDNTVAIEKDNEIMKWHISYNYPEWKIIEYDSMKEVEEAVRKGYADCFVAESDQLSRYIEDRTLHSVFLTQSANTSFAVKRDNTILLSVLNKTLKTMPAAMLTGALTMYETSLRKVSVLDFVKDNLVAVAISFITVFLVILTVVLYLLRKSRIAENKAKLSSLELQKNHQELEKALERAEKANSAKTTFLNHMSHDIRTPMNAIIGYTNIALKQNVNQIVRNCLNRISSSSELLLTLINDVLDISRIESGQTKITVSVSDINEITDMAISVTAGLLVNRNLNFEVKKEKLYSPYVMADAVRIREILVNVLSNAVKFTDDGGTVRFKSSARKNEDGNILFVRYVISDTGIGMSKEFMDHIFDEFSQENSDARTRYKGTGLGMAITKNYVDMMHGTISVKSEKGKGTEFVIELPLKAVERKDEIPMEKLADVSKVRNLRILMAEDNDLNAEIASYQLRESGMIVTRVSNGKEAVDIYEKTPEGFDLILMDVMMPEMNGYEATGKIREFEKETGRKRVPVIALTANAFAEDVKASMDAGMDGHVSKPIVSDALIKEIMKHIS